jgi:protein-tyrosine phosphatase
MIDIHSHILPGLDDGAQTIDESIEMARIAAEDGIKKIVGTPHLFRGNFKNGNFEVIDKKKRELKEALKQNKIDIEIYSGAEVHISHNLIEEIKSNKQCLVINQSSYMLTEFPSSHIFSGVKTLFFDLMSEGITPIITHPERNAVFMENPALLYELIEMGALTQVNSGSFVGVYGKRTADIVTRFLDWNFVHFVGSDSHNTRSMSPVLSDALIRIKERKGQDLASVLVFDNPQAVLDDRDLVHKPNPINPKERGKSLKVKIPIFKKRTKI